MFLQCHGQHCSHFKLLSLIAVILDLSCQHETASSQSCVLQGLPGPIGNPGPKGVRVSDSKKFIFMFYLCCSALSNTFPHIEKVKVQKRSSVGQQKPCSHRKTLLKFKESPCNVMVLLQLKFLVFLEFCIKARTTQELSLVCS